MGQTETRPDATTENRHARRRRIRKFLVGSPLVLALAPMVEVERLMVWFDGARCYGADPDIFFPTRGKSTVPEAKAICEPCPAKAECLHYATFVKPVKEEGIWGETTRLERRALRKAIA